VERGRFFLPQWRLQGIADDIDLGPARLMDLQDGDLLVCGISTQLRQTVADFDEIIEPSDADFKSSGLKAPR
jgi:hypothetical protein